MKRYLSLFVIFLMAFCVSCGERETATPPAPPTPQILESGEELKIAQELLDSKKYDECLAHLESSYQTLDLEEKRILLRILANTWIGNWKESINELNALVALAGKPEQIDQSLPRSLKDPEVIKEFRSFDFSFDDSLYLWRVLWQDRIVARLIEGLDSDMEKAVAILDYVYRHIKFGTIEGGHFNDKPFNVLVKGQGFCEELAWVANQFFRAAGIDATRLILWWPNQDVSPHTISMIRIGDDWIPVDPTAGLILQGARSRKPKGIPRFFIFDPDDPTYREFGNRLPSFGSYLEAIKDFGQYSRLNVTLPISHPFFDFESETCMPRFKWLAEHLDKVKPLKALAHPYVTAGIPAADPITGEITQWRGVELQYIFENNHYKNEVRRQTAIQLFAFLRSIQYARLALLSGQYAIAEKMFLEASQSEEFTPEAREDTAYYLGVSAFELKEYELAAKRFDIFMKAYPETRWESRVKYQQALIAFALGHDSEIPALLEACEQESEASFFYWMTELGLIQKQKDTTPSQPTETQIQEASG